jgi:signal peptidase I
MSKNEKELKEPAESAVHASKQIEPPKSIFREYFESFVVTLIMAIFGMTFILQAVTVPTGSMQNTINIGDYLLVNKFIFAPGGKPLPFLPQREVQRGDIIVFKYPGFPNNIAKIEDEGGPPYKINFVKRVIGLPGDKIEIRDNQVFINDQLLPEYRIIGDSNDEESALQTKEFENRQADQKWDVYYSERAIKGLTNDRDFDFGESGKPYKVPADSYFVMGDSRNHSLDSRYWGPVHRDLIIGRAMFVYWSCDRAAGDGSVLGCITHPRLERVGKMIK